MSCDKCEDIHTAQRAGKQNDECRCSCHSSTFTWHNMAEPQMIPCDYTGTPPWKQYETTCEDENPYKIGRQKLP